jgi:hypothetical protein
MIDACALYISIALRLLARRRSRGSCTSVSAREYSLHRFGPIGRGTTGQLLFAFPSPALRTGREFLCGRIAVGSAPGLARYDYASTSRARAGSRVSVRVRDRDGNVAFRFARYGRRVCICLVHGRASTSVLASWTVYREASPGTGCASDGLD